MDKKGQAVGRYRQTHHIVSVSKEVIERLADRAPNAISVDAALRHLLNMPPKKSYNHRSVITRYAKPNRKGKAA